MAMPQEKISKILKKQWTKTEVKRHLAKNKCKTYEDEQLRILEVLFFKTNYWANDSGREKLRNYIKEYGFLLVYKGITKVMQQCLVMKEFYEERDEEFDHFQETMDWLSTWLQGSKYISLMTDKNKEGSVIYEWVDFVTQKNF
jgi:hypothetical protein